MRRIGLIGLLRIDLPSRSVLLCDGGFMPWGSDVFQSIDPTFGTIAGLDSLKEGADEEVPDMEIRFLPPQSAPIADLSQPGYQKCRVRLWLAEYNPDEGLLVGEPEMQFDGQIDQTVLTLGGDGSRELSVTIVSTAERLFERNLGNSLTGSFHKSVWPGETGHDNATGLGIPVAWGVEAAPSIGGSYLQYNNGWSVDQVLNY
jgi:hypothetical protein